MNELDNMPGHLAQIRPDLVARVRQEIQAGVYETPEKLKIAIERLMVDIQNRRPSDETTG